jgi:hypothetical protein
VLTLAVLLVGTGVFATNVLGQWWLHQWDKVLHRVPIVKSIYSSVKQVSATRCFPGKGQAFSRALYCGLVTEALMGQTVTLCGWVNRRRDHGGVIFIDLRDREGYVQVVCDPDRAEMFKTAEDVRNEFCVQVKGLVRARPRARPTTASRAARSRCCATSSRCSTPRSRRRSRWTTTTCRKPRASRTA